MAREVDPARQNRPSCAETRAVDPVRQACGAPRCRTGNSWVTVIVVNVTFYSLVTYSDQQKYWGRWRYGSA